MIYKHLIKPVLFRFDPTRVHGVMVWLGEQAGRTAMGRGAIALAYAYREDDASTTVDGIHYHTPVVLSAGFDSDGRLTNILPSVGFGGVEVGSVTARPCSGNPPPNMTRLKRTGSIIVNKGLRNEGVERIAARLAKRIPHAGFAVGVSIARTNDTESCELAAGIEDYATSLTVLTEQGVGDWYTINISCPNSFTGELFTDPKNLELLLSRLDRVATGKPMYLKMPISVAPSQFLQICECAARHRVRGLIIGNLQKDYAHIVEGDGKPATYRGGLSGVPCREDANRLLSLAKETYQDRFTLIGCGGTFTADDALEKFERGASLIHLITGMIFNGPALIGDIAKAYAAWKKKKGA